MSDGKHPDEDTDRIDYAATLVKPKGWVVVCPSCDHEHTTNRLTPYRCPECNKAITVNI